MIYRALDANGDYLLGQQIGEFLQGDAAVIQAVQTRLMLLQGEWWEDTSDGLPLFQSILNKPGTSKSFQAIDLLIRQRIASTSGVASVQTFKGSYFNRQYSIACTIKTLSGSIANVEVTF